MIALVPENYDIEKHVMAPLAQSLMREGEAVEVWADVPPVSGAAGDIEPLTQCAVQYMLWAANHRYSRYRDAPNSVPWWERRAQWYLNCWRQRLEESRPDVVLIWATHEVVSWSARLAAAEAGVPVAFLENGLFPSQDGDVPVIITRDVPYYVLGASLDRAEWFASWEPHTQRVRDYGRWWRRLQQTKPGHQRLVALRETVVEPGDTVWFGQVEWDNALYVQPNVEQVLLDLRSAAEREGAWFKPHPRCPSPAVAVGYSRRLAADLNIHSILSLPHIKVLTLCSNVALEAWFYAQETLVYGSTFYGKTREEQDPGMSWQRLKVLDYVLSHLQIVRSDSPRILARIRGDDVL
jgi:hypothetical protein